MFDLYFIIPRDPAERLVRVMGVINGVEFYDGQSAYNGKPIVGIATCLTRPSANTKTGDMIQTYFFAKGEPPGVAAMKGMDEAVCGNCALRRFQGEIGACYVNLWKSTYNVYRAWTEGVYPKYNAKEHGKLFKRAPIRLGTYGDPASIPFDLAHRLVHMGKQGWTGYTHLWKTCDPKFKTICVASVNSSAEREEAIARGWWTFRVKGVNDINLANESSCPASEERGHVLTCAKCLACGSNGIPKLTSGILKTATINFHGAMKKRGTVA